MFADDTSLFYIEENIKAVFDTVSIELQNSGLHSINISKYNKNKILIFHKPSKKDNIPLVLLKLSMCNNEIKRSESIKFLCVFLDENLTWEDRIRYTENKFAKNIGLLLRSKPYLTKKCLITI